MKTIFARKNLVFLIPLILSVGCGKVEKKDKITKVDITYEFPTSPFHLKWDTPPQEINIICHEIQANLIRELEAINKTDGMDVENVLDPLEWSLGEFNNHLNELFVISELGNNKSQSEAARTCFQQSNDNLFPWMNKYNMFGLLKRLSLSGKKLTPAQKKLLDYYVSLIVDETFDQTKEYEIGKELQKLQNAFNQELQIAQDTIVATQDQMEYLNVSYPNIISKIENSKSKAGMYEVTLQVNGVNSLYGSIRSDIRELAYYTDNTRGGKQNSNRMTEIAKLRHQLALNRKEKSFAHLSLKSKMVRDPEHLSVFLDELKNVLTDHYHSERKILLATKLENAGHNDFTVGNSILNPWDESFYEKIAHEKVYQYNNAEAQNYFPVNSVINGMFTTFGNVLGIQIVRGEGVKTWAPSVMPFAIINKGEKVEEKNIIGWLYLDLYAREGKTTGGPFTTGIRYGYVHQNGEHVPPITVISMNLSYKEKHVTVLGLKEITTFFHEFGHAMHIALARQQYYSQHSLSAGLDFVEAPSQLFENWALNPDILISLSSHYQTSKKIPADFAQKLITAFSRSTAKGHLMNAFLSSFDLALYNGQNLNDGATELYAKMYNDYLGYALPANIFPEASFKHIVNNYAANYFSYTWSRVISQSLFTKFKEHNNIQDPEIGALYRKTILEPANSEDSSDIIHKFLGREPSTSDFLN